MKKCPAFVVVTERSSNVRHRCLLLRATVWETSRLAWASKDISLWDKQAYRSSLTLVPSATVEVLYTTLSQRVKKGHYYHDVVQAWTWSVFCHRKAVELSLCRVMSTSFPCDKRSLYPIHRLRSCKKVVWKCYLNKTKASKRLAKHVSISLNAISEDIAIYAGCMVLPVPGCRSWF